MGGCRLEGNPAANTTQHISTPRNIVLTFEHGLHTWNGVKEKPREVISEPEWQLGLFNVKFGNYWLIIRASSRQTGEVPNAAGSGLDCGRLGNTSLNLTLGAFTASAT